MSHSDRRPRLAAVLIVVVVCGGCLTTGPSVTADTGDSAVFEQVSTDEPWASQHVRVNATLRSTPAAGNVTTITVVDADGRPYTTVGVASGQTKVTLWVPTGQNATLVASNTANSTTLDTLNVTTGGNRVF